MLNKPVLTLDDFSGGLFTQDKSFMAMKSNTSPDVMNYRTDFNKALIKRKGFSKLNTTAFSGFTNGLNHYVQSATVEYLVSLVSSTLQKMDVVNNAWDGTWDTIAKHASGTQLSDAVAHFSTWSNNGTLIITTEDQDVPQRINATDVTYINLHDGGAGTAPSGKFSFVWRNHVWIANISGNPDRLQRSASTTYDDWTGTDSGSQDIITEADIGLTGLAELNGRLYVWKKWSIHRVTYLGGSPYLDYTQVKSSVGTNSPKSIVHVNLPEGERIMFYGTDRNIYIFNGYQTAPLTVGIFNSNGLSDIYMQNISLLQANRVHAVNDVNNHMVYFFVPISSSIDIDTNTKLLLHCDGADGSTTFSDRATGKTITANGNAQIDTAQYKFGGASFLSDGTGDSLSTPDHADFYFGTGKFTVDLQVRFNSISSPAEQMFYEQDDGTNHIRMLYYDTNNEIRIMVYEGTPTSAYQIYFTCPWTPSANSWYHIAIVRDGTVAGDHYIFIDGISQTLTLANGAWTGEFVDLAAPVTISSATAGQSFNGWIDEVRVSKGVARWTSNFTAPTKAYGGEPTHSIGYDYYLKSFWPYDNMNFQSSTFANDGAGEKKVYVSGVNHTYLFDDGTDDDGSAISTYWTSHKMKLKNVAVAKHLYQTEVITNNAAYTLTYQQRKDWDSSWTSAVTLKQSQERHVLQTERITNLIQYKLNDNSSGAGSEIYSLEISAEVVGVGK